LGLSLKGVPMLHPQRRIPLFLATLLTFLVALSACGGDSSSQRMRNAALDTRTCAEGGQCVVGDTGPGGGVVFYDAGEDREWGRYLEAAQLSWGDGLPDALKSSLYKSHGGEMVASLNEGALSSSAPFSTSNVSLGGGKAAWEAVKDFRCNRCITNIIAEQNKGAIDDWYLPNKTELGELFKSNVRPMNSRYYWTSTGSTTNSKKLVRMTINFSARAVQFWYTFQVESYSFIPIRAFSSTPLVEAAAPEETTTVPEETTTTTEVTTTTVEATATTSTTTLAPQVFNPVTNVQAAFEGDYMNVTFTLQQDGVKPEGHFVTMDWPTGRNSVMLNKNAFVTSIFVPQYFRGEKVGVSVRSFTNATQPSQTVDTEVIVLDIPRREPEAEPTPPVTPASDENLGQAISVLQAPILNLPEEEVTSVINREQFFESVESQLPELTVEKVEIQVITPDSDMDEPFVELTSNNIASFAIPANATQVNLLVTGSQGEVVEQNKLIVRVNKEGTQIAPTDVPGSTDTTVPPSDDESSETTVVSTPGEVSSDDPTSGSPIMWLLIALVALLLAAFGVRQLRR
jgi:hypothetical protein